MELSEYQQMTTSSYGAAGRPSHGDVRSPVLAEVVIDVGGARRSPSIRAADELSDEEAEAFFLA